MKEAEYPFQMETINSFECGHAQTMQQSLASEADPKDEQREGDRMNREESKGSVLLQRNIALRGQRYGVIQA
jgi:hypothetical protein